ncbi:YkgJ family cysteine cluster protein [bacterium]|nr:YkgJ family cysteine cluster protein [bacterium]
MTGALRAGLELREENGAALLLDPDRRARHEVPRATVERVRAALAGAPVDERILAWLEARHLVASERARRVEEWGRSLAEPRAERPLAIVPGTRFTCHGCGLCCESYVAGPISASEREAILARASELAPSVAAPREAWFLPSPHVGPDGREAFFLGRDESGKCVFLGADKLCSVHKHLGIAAKPFVCRRFPLQVTERDDATVVSVRSECATLDRSREDGQPLPEQLGWVQAIVAGEWRPVVVPRLVRVVGDIFVPQALALEIEQRALRLMRAAPSVEEAHIAIRDLTVATMRTLEPSPGVAALERTREFAASAPLDLLAEAIGHARPERALASLARLLSAISQAIDAPRSPTSLPRGVRGEAQDDLGRDVVRTLAASLASRSGSAAPASEAALEAARAARVDAGAGERPVVDFVRECFVQAIGSSQPLASPAGLVAGFAQLALQHALARQAARLSALRRGASVASREDWRDAFLVTTRLLGLFSLAGCAPVLVSFYEDLFLGDDLLS